MANKIVEVAKGYLHKKEITGNMGFEDKVFQKKMEDVGFVKTYAWCALFGELCVKEGNPEFYAKHEKLFSTSAVVTYRNFKAAGMVSDKPAPGYLACWQHGRTANGHLGVVEIGNVNLFSTFEGNSNSNGSREGIEVAYKPDRKLVAPFTPSGLNLLGFVKTDV